ncbi:MAG: TetR/AcrR family transcriptional regulator, partial [Clostridiales bacterium]|nr:TetR/AcrR family transcriptional regulator [Clostridiales bacterium]
MTRKAEIKRALILTRAKEVFVRNGFNRTTMKDIIDECGISRGGIYLYFSSTAEIFVECVRKHNQAKLQEFIERIEKCADFNLLLNEFFDSQTDRLLHMEESLFVAMVEFCFRDKSFSERDFYAEQFSNTKKMILALLSFGQKESAVQTADIHRLADTVLCIFEGV